MESRLRCSLGFLGFGSDAWAAAFLRRLGPGAPGVAVEAKGWCCEEEAPMGVLLPVGVEAEEDGVPGPDGPDGGRDDICVCVYMCGSFC